MLIIQEDEELQCSSNAEGQHRLKNMILGKSPASWKMEKEGCSDGSGHIYEEFHYSVSFRFLYLLGWIFMTGWEKQTEIGDGIFRNVIDIFLSSEEKNSIYTHL